MIDCDAFDDCLEKHRLSGACRGDDQCALAVSDWCDEIDCAAGELGTALCGAAGLELELALGIRCDERTEIGTPECEIRLASVDLRDSATTTATARVASRGCKHRVTATEVVLLRHVGRHICIRRIGEIAVCSAANEAAVARWVVPSHCLAVGNDRRHRLPRSLVALSAIVARRVRAGCDCALCPCGCRGSFCAISALCRRTAADGCCC